MTTLHAASSKLMLLGGGGVLVVAVAAWGVSAHFSTPVKPPPPDPEKLIEALQKPDLTEAQRQELEHNMHEAFRAQMDTRVQEYFTAPEEEKAVVLDRHIDEWQKRMQEMEKRREERRAQREEGEDQAERRDGPTSRPHHDPGAMSVQERKTRSETRNPDEMARRMAYFQAMRERMEARGIQMPHGPGPGPGGRGPGGRGPWGGHGGGPH